MSIPLGRSVGILSGLRWLLDCDPRGFSPAIEDTATPSDVIFGVLKGWLLVRKRVVLICGHGPRNPI